MPNWNKFKNIVNKMITTDLGAESVTITTPGVITYNFITGEEETDNTVSNIKTALIPTNKDDLDDIPEGLREKVTKKIFTVSAISKNAHIVSDFDSLQYEVIVPSVAYTAGGLVHCYKTYLGKVENVSVPVSEDNDE